MDLFHPHHPGDGAAQKSDEPAAVDGDADPVEDAVDCFGLFGQRGYERQEKMEGHPPQRGDSRNIVPLGRFAVGYGDEVHLVGSQVVAEQADAEDDQVLFVQSLLSSAEDRPGVKEQRQVHPEYRLQQHRLSSRGYYHDNRERIASPFEDRQHKSAGY